MSKKNKNSRPNKLMRYRRKDSSIIEVKPPSKKTSAYTPSEFQTPKRKDIET